MKIPVLHSPIEYRKTSACVSGIATAMIELTGFLFEKTPDFRKQGLLSEPLMSWMKSVYGGRRKYVI
jgi:hypothetical protein